MNKKQSSSEEQSNKNSNNNDEDDKKNDSSSSSQPLQFNSQGTYYKFQMDMTGIAANMMKIWHGPANSAVVVVQQLMDLANQVLKEVVDLQDHEQIDDLKLQSSAKFSKFQEQTCELQGVDLEELDKKEALVFFMNLLQIMYLHNYMLTRLKQKKGGSADQQNNNGGFFFKLLSFIPVIGPKQIKEEFFYLIGKNKFTINDVKHGILRGNKRPDFKTDFTCFGKKDPRLEYV